MGLHGKDYLLTSETYKISDLNLMLNHQEQIEKPIILICGKKPKKTMKKTLLFLLAFSFFATLQAQENTNLTFNHLALSVKSLDESATFYKQVLGLPEITNKTKMQGVRWFSLNEGKELHLISFLKEPVIINKAVHMALTTSNFDAFVKSLEAKKIPYSDWPGIPNKINIRADGIKQIFFQDPNGYWIEINSVIQK